MGGSCEGDKVRFEGRVWRILERRVEFSQGRVYRWWKCGRKALMRTTSSRLSGIIGDEQSGVLMWDSRRRKTCQGRIDLLPEHQLLSREVSPRWTFSVVLNPKGLLSVSSIFIQLRR